MHLLHRGRQLQKMAEFSGFLQEDARACGSFWRSGPESNRHTRICSPLHHHSATGPQVAGQAGKTEGIRRLRPRKPYSTVVGVYPECPRRSKLTVPAASLVQCRGVRRCLPFQAPVEPTRQALPRRLIAARQVPLQSRSLPLKLLRELTEVLRAVHVLHDPGRPPQARRAIPEATHGLSLLRLGMPRFFRHVSNWLTDI
jgi:hypothetical protein